MRGETWPLSGIIHKFQFQSTLPMRGETRSHVCAALLRISIHSPHAGRDVIVSARTCWIYRISIHSPHAGRDSTGPLPVEHQISIHSPHAGRDASHRISIVSGLFQSTLPMRGETGATSDSWPSKISIHSPHAGRDVLLTLR